MSYSLEVWIAQQLRDVDEDGTCTAKIILRSVDTGTPWQTWTISRAGEFKTAPGPLIEEITNVQNGLAEQFPVGKNHIVFVALDTHGADVARFPSFIMGRNRSASASGLMQTEAGTAISQTMTAFAETFRNVLAPVNAQFALGMKHQEALQQTVLGQSQFINALLEKQIIDKQERADAKAEDGPDLMNALKEYMPAILEIVQTAVSKPGPARATVRAVAEGLSKHATNGASPIKGEN